MEVKTAVDEQLAGMRQGLEADGYSLQVDDVTNGVARLRIVAGPEACEECLVPKNMMVSMLETSLKSISDVNSVEVAYPGE